MLPTTKTRLLGLALDLIIIASFIIDFILIAPFKEDNIKDFIGNRNKEEKFNEAILRLIDMSGKKDSDIYKKGWVSKETFSKVRITGNVSKMTALQLCIALELDIKETKSMLAKAGLTLGNNTSDYIFEFYITKGIYDINMINETLFDNGCKTILKKN